ncbi:cytochrome b/b6 domain-containing protein [Kaistella haifensis]|nr:cytochrome b/b6 domain-containing protein [Kaistella haifensis]
MKKFTTLHRIIHWLIAFAMLVLFSTGFLRMYWMSKKTITTAISAELSKNNVQLPQESVVGIAKSIINPMFDWHINFAYVLVFAYILRIIYLLAKGVRYPNPFSKSSTGKEKLQGTVYSIFYILLAVQIVTGFALMWQLASEQALERAEKIHKFAVYWMPVFVLLHFAGITVAELTNKKGITSKMIGGE